MSEQTREDTVDKHHGIANSVESDGLDANAITWRVIVGVIVFLIAVFAVVEVTGIKFQEARTNATTITGYPKLQETRIEANRLLSNYEVLDIESGIYRIPIDRAMELVAAEASVDGSLTAQ